MQLKYARLLIALLLLAAGLVQLTASPATTYWRTYYTDASKTVECGYADVACNGTHYSGCWTSYYTDEILGTCGGSGSDCDEAKVGSECADHFDNDGDGKIDGSDSGCVPCYARFE